MKRKKFLSIISLLIILTISLTACGGNESGNGGEDHKAGKGDKIVIAHAGPMTGDSAQFGDMKGKAIQLAIDETNEKGGINGKEVAQLTGDDTGNPKEAPSVAQRFAQDDSVLAVIGHWNSSCTLAARGIYDASGIPLLADSVNKALTDRTTPTAYRISLTDTVQAQELAEYAYNKMGKRKAAIMYTANDFGTGLMNDFAKAFEELGGEIVASETYFEGQSKDFSPQLTKIKGTNPDLMFIAGYYVETALIAQQSKEMGLDVQMLGTEGISSEELIKLGGDAVEGIVFAGFFHPDIEYPGTKEFVDNFRAKYNKEPDTYAALAYDSAKLIFAAIEKNGESREAILKYLDEVEDFPGVAGPISFNENHDVVRNIVVLTVKDGKIVPASEQID